MPILLPRLFLVAFCLILICAGNAFAQKNEVSFIAGGGKLSSDGGSVGASAFTIAYTRTLIGGLAAEGSIDFFFIKNGSLSNDDYGAFQAAVVYHLPSVKTTKFPIFYVTAGIGKVSTDFTEIPGEKVYRLGGGVKYYLSENHKYGLRFEVRDEITTRGSQGYPISGDRLHLLSVRGGISCRF
jgi:hypothetical protein